MAAEGGGGTGGISKTIVEVYVETDSESEPYSSSEGEDGSEATLTAQEGGLEEEGGLGQDLHEPGQPVGRETPQAVPPDMIPHQLSSPPIISSSGIFIFVFTMCVCVHASFCMLHTAIAPGDSPFPELLDQESGFDLYDPELAGTPPDVETHEMEMDIVVDDPTSSDIGGQPLIEPNTKSDSHSPSVQSSSTTVQPLTSKPKQEDASVIKHDPETLPVGLCEPPDNDPTKLYCLCQEPATFSMIPCHKCLNWFHGECVGLTRQKAATVKQFYCPLCIDKDPNLVTMFESRAEREAMLKKERGQLPSQTKGSRKGGKKHSRR